MKFLAGYIVAGCAFLGIALGGVWYALTPAVAFGLIPLLDFLIRQPTPKNGQLTKSQKRWMDAKLFAWVPVQLALIIFGLYQTHGLQGGWAVVLCAITVGIATGAIGITIAHELMHRSGRFERAMAEVLMTSVTYSHFQVEHVLGHHLHVGTRPDPATARHGESLFMFLPRALVTALTSAWSLETSRVQKRGEARTLKDRRLRYALTTVAIYAMLGVLGWQALLFFALQSLTAVILLESVNYIEHYGLVRMPLSTGRIEVVRPKHSWNASNPVSSALLFNLPRHSDHHAYAFKKYYELDDRQDAPQLPTGYAAMILLAWVPPIFFRVMNPRVKQANTEVAE